MAWLLLLPVRLCVHDRRAHCAGDGGDVGAVHVCAAAGGGLPLVVSGRGSAGEQS